MPVRSLIIWGVVAIVLVVLFAAMDGGNTSREGVIEVPYSTFLTHVDEGRVDSANTQGTAILFTERDRRRFITHVPEGAMADTVRRLYDGGVQIRASPARAGPTLGDILLGILPMLLLIGAWYFFMLQIRQSRGGGDGPASPR